MKCFYHNDMDGKAAGFAVACLVRNERPAGTDCEFIAMDYGKPFPILTIDDNEEVWIVDFSIQTCEMDALLGCTKNVVWIDHHKTAIEKYSNYDHCVPGIRVDGVAGCVLTWQYCFPNTLLPRMIELVGDRDVWNWFFGEQTSNFHSGAAMRDTSPTSSFWIEVLNDGSKTFNDVINSGKTINAYKSRFYAEMLHDIGFEASIDGHKCICMNACHVGSEAFGPDALDNYPIVSSFYHNGKYFTVSLYSKSVDVSEIAKSRGGGGHKGASGFQCDTLPYTMEAS